MNPRFFHLVATSALAAACLCACGGGGGGGGAVPSTSTSAAGAPVTPNTPAQPSQPSQSSQPGASFGTVALAMTAEPGCGYDAINVTVTKIRFHASASAAGSDAGWTDIALQPARRINLAQLNNGVVTALGTAALLPGHYAQARLVLDQNSANTTTNSVVAAGAIAETPLLTQTAAPDGVVIDLGAGFDVVNGQSLTLVADFDGCRSIATSGASVVLRPVITVLPAVKNGIDGVVDPALLGSNVRVSAQQNGVVVRAALPAAGSGAFSLSYLPPGSYEVVITADGHAAAVIAGVKVADSSAVLALNSAAAPIALPASATGAITAVLVLQPASNIDAAFGTAYQTFNNGPRVSIRDRMAGIGGGFVRFDNLPLSRPSLAVWNGQPLVFTEQAAIVEGAATYTILSTAPGYVTTSAATAVAR